MFSTSSDYLRQTPMDFDRLNLLLFLRNPFVKHCPSGKLGQVYTWWHNTYVEAAVPSVPHLPCPSFCSYSGLLTGFRPSTVLTSPFALTASEQDRDRWCFWDVGNRGV